MTGGVAAGAGVVARGAGAGAAVTGAVVGATVAERGAGAATVGAGGVGRGVGAGVTGADALDAAEAAGGVVGVQDDEPGVRLEALAQQPVGGGQPRLTRADDDDVELPGDLHGGSTPGRSGAFPEVGGPEYVIEP